jgi:hypothetical protein
MTKFFGVSLGRSTLGSIRHFFGWQFQIVIYLIDSQIKKMEKFFFKAIITNRISIPFAPISIAFIFNSISFQFNSSCMQSRVYCFKWFIMYVCNNSNDYLFKIIIAFSEEKHEKANVTCAFSCLCYIVKSKLRLTQMLMNSWKPYGNIWKK